MILSKTGSEIPTAAFSATQPVVAARGQSRNVHVPHQAGQHGRSQLPDPQRRAQPVDELSPMRSVPIVVPLTVTRVSIGTRSWKHGERYRYTLE